MSSPWSKTQMYQSFWSPSPLWCMWTSLSHISLGARGTQWAQWVTQCGQVMQRASGKHVREDRQLKQQAGGPGPVRVAGETAGTFGSGPGGPDGWGSCGGGGVWISSGAGLGLLSESAWGAAAAAGGSSRCIPSSCTGCSTAGGATTVGGNEGMGRAASSCCEVLLRDIYNTACHKVQLTPTPWSSSLHWITFTPARVCTCKTVVRIDNIPVASKTCLSFNKGHLILTKVRTTLNTKELCSHFAVIYF